MDRTIIDKTTASIAELRRQGDFRGAVDVAKNAALEISEDEGKLEILLRGFDAAKEANLLEDARDFATQLHELDPGETNVCKFLGVAPKSLDDDGPE